MHTKLAFAVLLSILLGVLITTGLSIGVAWYIILIMSVGASLVIFVSFLILEEEQRVVNRITREYPNSDVDKV